MSVKARHNLRLHASLKKSPFYWLRFALFFSIVSLVAYHSFIQAFANIAWQQNPDLALRFVPDHSLALSLNADIQFMKSQNATSLEKVEAMAKLSLTGQPLNAVAVRLLGYTADVRGDRKKARYLMSLAHRISRRDLGTQLWLIEDAVARGEKKQAIYHYDIAMRTTTSSRPLLFPPLVDALADPDVRKGLVPYIRQAPVWLPGFLNEAIYNSENPANVADVLIRSGRLPDKQVYDSLSNSLLSQLAVKSKFAAFRQYYLSLSDSSTATFRSVVLDAAAVHLRYPVAGWQLVQNSAIGGEFASADKSGRHSLSVFAGSGERGELMRKYIFLNPGKYRFSSNYDAHEGAANSEIRWELSCMSANNSKIVWFATAPVRQGPSAMALDFKIGANCPNQLLMLQLAGGSGQTGVELIIQSVDIKSR